MLCSYSLNKQCILNFVTIHSIGFFFFFCHDLFKDCLFTTTNIKVILKYMVYYSFLKRTQQIQKICFLIIAEGFKTKDKLKQQKIYSSAIKNT